MNTWKFIYKEMNTSFWNFLMLPFTSQTITP